MELFSRIASQNYCLLSGLAVADKGLRRIAASGNAASTRMMRSPRAIVGLCHLFA
jgi:hypothetical protein